MKNMFFMQRTHYFMTHLRNEKNILNGPKILSLSCFLLFYVSMVVCQPATSYSKLTFEHITIRDGLPAPYIRDILQDREGFMWFATENGLCRYDSYDFRTYQFNPFDTTTISGNDVKCIYEDNQGNIWAGMANTGISILNKKDGLFTNYIADSLNQNSLWADRINKITGDQNGIIWIATGGGLNKYLPDNKNFRRIHLAEKIHVKTINKTLYSNSGISIYNCIPDSVGNLWLGTWGYGLIKLETDSYNASQYLLSNTLEKNIIKCIIPDKNGILHLGSEYIPHLIFDSHVGKIIDTLNAREGSLYTGLTDHLGTLWAGSITKKELNLYTGSEKMSYQPDGDNKKSISGGDITTIFRDDCDNIWFSSTGFGLDVYFPRKNTFQKYYRHIEETAYKGYGRTLYIDSEGNLWYGTFGEGILLFDKNHRQIKRFLSNENSKNALTGNYIWSITEDSAGNVWIGTNNGISVYDKQKRKIVNTIQNRKNINRLLTHKLINDIYHDSRGYTWIATQEGLDLMAPDGNVTHITESDGLSHYRVWVVFEDNLGSIWLGTYNGLSQYMPRTNTFHNYLYRKGVINTLSNPLVLSITQDAKGFIWVGTESGLNKINPETKTIEKYLFEKDGLLHNRINNIFLDQNNILWLQSSNGISLLDPLTEKITNFTENDGLYINNTGMYVKDSIVVAGNITAGYYTFHISDIRTNPHVPPVHITKVLVNGYEINHQKAESNLEINPSEKHKKLIAQQSSTISLEFTALNYLSPEKNIYSYKLEGYDAKPDTLGWHNTDANRRIAKYTNLKPGDYVFKVRGSNNSLVWNMQGDSFAFKVLPPWWRSWWAYSVYSFIFLAIFLLLLLIIKKSNQIHLEKEKSQLQHKADEQKLKFFTNISHDFRTPLSLITIIIESVLERKKITDEDSNSLHLAHKNIRRLKILVNQLLDSEN